MVNIPPIHIYLWWWLGDGLYCFTHTRTSRNGKVYQTWGICSPSYPPDGIKILGREAWGIMVFKTSAVHLLVVKKRDVTGDRSPVFVAAGQVPLSIEKSPAWQRGDLVRSIRCCCHDCIWTPCSYPHLLPVFVANVIFTCKKRLFTFSWIGGLSIHKGTTFPTSKTIEPILLLFLKKQVFGDYLPLNWCFSTLEQSQKAIGTSQKWLLNGNSHLIYPVNTHY